MQWGWLAATVLMGCGVNVTLFGDDTGTGGAGGQDDPPITCAGVLCDMRNDCTDAACVDDQCVYNITPGEPCALGDRSDGVCDDAGVCQPALCESLRCNDANPCTADKCDPAIGCVYEPADGPGIDDGNKCTADECIGGLLIYTPLEPGAPCGTDLPVRYVCDGRGDCVECVTTDHCNHLPIDTECSRRTCVSNQCGVMREPQGTVLSAGYQTPGDCRVVVCDGEGDVTLAHDDSDVPDDDDACTIDSCINGTPKQTPLCPAQQCFNGVCF